MGLLVGVGFFVAGLALYHQRVFLAFGEGAGTALLTMAVLGAAQRLWRGDKLSSAGAGGAQIGFDNATGDAVEKIERVVTELNARMNDQMTTINDRLYDLEKVVFKDVEAEEREG